MEKVGSRIGGVTGTADQGEIVYGRIRCNGHALKAKDVIGPFTPIHITDLRPEESRTNLNVSWLPPRPGGPPATTADNGEIIINSIVLRLIIPKARRTVIDWTHLRDLADNFFNDCALQAVVETRWVSVMNMNMTVMIMYCLGETMRRGCPSEAMEMLLCTGLREERV